MHEGGVKEKVMCPGVCRTSNKRCWEVKSNYREKEKGAILGCWDPIYAM